MATITKRGDTYKITVSSGYDIDGKQIRKHLTWTPAPGMTARQITKELERQKVLFEEKCRTGQVLDGGIRLADFAERWFTDYAEQQLRLSTVAGYRRLMKKILPALGHIRLDRLQPHHLLSFYNNLQEAGMREHIAYHFRNDFPERLRRLGLTQADLARMSSLAEARLSRCILHGCGLFLENAQRVADAAGLPLDEVFEPAKADGKLSNATIQRYHALLSSILSTAVEWQIIFANPCDRVRPPKLERKEARFLDAGQAAQLLEALDDAPEQYRVMVYLLLYTGLRRGELLGLEWQDVDFDRRLLDVQRSSLYLPGRGIFSDDTKNSTSRRVISLPADAVSLLRQHRAHQQEERLRLGDQWQDSGRLFTAWNGAPLPPDTFSHWFSDFVKRHDLPPATAHSLRHTNATLLIAGGVNIKTVSAHMGHSVTSTTGNIYAHAIKEAEAAAAEIIPNALSKLKKKA